MVFDSNLTIKCTTPTPCTSTSMNIMTQHQLCWFCVVWWVCVCVCLYVKICCVVAHLSELWRQRSHLIMAWMLAPSISRLNVEHFACLKDNRYNFGFNLIRLRNKIQSILFSVLVLFLFSLGKSKKKIRIPRVTQKYTMTKLKYLWFILPQSI
jgi:hypothetical protein